MHILGILGRRGWERARETMNELKVVANFSSAVLCTPNLKKIINNNNNNVELRVPNELWKLVGLEEASGWPL